MRIKKTGLIIGAGGALLLYLGINNTVKTFQATEKIDSGILHLENHCINYNPASLDSAKTEFVAAEKTLSEHLHIFSIGVDASEINKVMPNLTVNNHDYIINTAIPKLKEIRNSYSGPGNCPIAKIIFPIGVIMLGILHYVIEKIQRQYNETQSE